MGAKYFVKRFLRLVCGNSCQEINGSGGFQKAALGEVGRGVKDAAAGGWPASCECVSSLRRPAAAQRQSAPHFVETHTSKLGPHFLLLGLSFFGESTDASS